MSREHIRSAFPVLTSIQNELKGGSPSASKLLALSNQFYTLIPHVFDSGEVQLIDNAELLQSKIEMIETLLEIEVSAVAHSGGMMLHRAKSRVAHSLPCISSRCYVSADCHQVAQGR